MATEAQKRAVKKYIAEKTDDIRLRVKKGTKERYAEEAKKRGMSTTKFIVYCVEKEIDEAENETEGIARRNRENENKEEEQ